MLHYHHKDAEPCHEEHDWPEWIHAAFATIIHSEERIMAAQDQINADIATIGEALTSMATEISSQAQQIANQHPEADTSGLDALAQRAHDLAASVTGGSAAPQSPAPTTSTPAPADAPVDPSAPAPVASDPAAAAPVDGTPAQ